MVALGSGQRALSRVPPDLLSLCSLQRRVIEERSWLFSLRDDEKQVLSWLFSSLLPCILVWFILYHFPPPSALTEATSPPPPRDLLHTASAREWKTKPRAAPRGRGRCPGGPGCRCLRSAALPGACGLRRAEGQGRRCDAQRQERGETGKRGDAGESFLPPAPAALGLGVLPPDGAWLSSSFGRASLQPLAHLSVLTGQFSSLVLSGCRGDYSNM